MEEGTNHLWVCLPLAQKCSGPRQLFNAHVCVSLLEKANGKQARVQNKMPYVELAAWKLELESMPCADQ
jgi:hypothetical protein